MTPDAGHQDGGVRRLIQEIAAEPTRSEARAIFEGTDVLFVSMTADEREALYTQIDDLINEKPDQ